MTHALFVMEQHIGHQTYYQNLRRAIEQDGTITSTWAPVTYKGVSRLLDRIPGLPQRLRSTLHGALQARSAVTSGDYDVAFFNTQVPGVLAGRTLRRLPYIVATDITPLQYDQMSHHYGHQPDRAGLLAAYKHQRNVALLRGAARILPWSSWTGRSLIDDYGVNPGKIDVVAPGIDLQRWYPGERNAAGPLQILFVGGDLYRKGGDTLLKAFRTLPKGAAELHLVTRTQIEPEAGVHPYYTLQPNSPELIALYKRSDVFTLPTEAEAFGIAAIEATASGLATITTAVGGLVDIVADGESGYLIPAGDVGALSERLARLAASAELRQRMGCAARARAERYFDAQRNGARIISHLLAVAEQGRSRNQVVQHAPGGTRDV